MAECVQRVSGDDTELERLAEALIDDSQEHTVCLAVPQQRHVDAVLVAVIQFSYRCLVDGAHLLVLLRLVGSSRRSVFETAPALRCHRSNCSVSTTTRRGARTFPQCLVPSSIA